MPVIAERRFLFSISRPRDRCAARMWIRSGEETKSVAMPPRNGSVAYPTQQEASETQRLWQGSVVAGVRPRESYKILIRLDL